MAQCLMRHYRKNSSGPVIINPTDLPAGASVTLDGTIVFTQSVVWTIPSKYGIKKMDAFVVGGGGGGNYFGATGSGGVKYPTTCAGGGGGYTSTLKDIELQNNDLVITIGAGGTGGTSAIGSKRDGGPSSIAYNDTQLAASGGYSVYRDSYVNGGNGGCGGGSRGSNGGSVNPGSGGSNGGNGGNATGSGGVGQGRTTKIFEDENGTPYAGGGGGGVIKTGNTDYITGAGGHYGGGTGAGFWFQYSTGPSSQNRSSPGIANTGGGGGGGAYRNTNYYYGGSVGGSGVVMIRLYK